MTNTSPRPRRTRIHRAAHPHGAVVVAILDRATRAHAVAVERIPHRVTDARLHDLEREVLAQVSPTTRHPLDWPESPVLDRLHGVAPLECDHPRSTSGPCSRCSG